MGPQIRICMFAFCLFMISEHKSVLAATYFLQIVSIEMIPILSVGI